MSTAAEHLTDPELLAAEWDLGPLVDGAGAEGATAMLDAALARASEFASRYAGRIKELDGPSLAEAMHELEAIEELVGRAGSFASLRFSTDTADPERGALLQMVQERGTEIETRLLFFELEWAALDDAQAEEILSVRGLDFCRHHLRSARRYRPHLLTEPEEKVLAEKSISSQAAWARLFGELVAALRVKLDGEELTLDTALSRLQSPGRDFRSASADSVTDALERGRATRAFIFKPLT